MKWSYIVAGAMAMAVSPALVEAAPIWHCEPPRGVVSVALPAGLPPALRDKIGDIALPGEPSDAIDVYVKGHKHRRYIFVWNAGAKWIVATEQGGIALFFSVSAYRLGEDGKTVTLISTGFANDVCDAAAKLAGG
jgi:hypothetical protein